MYDNVLDSELWFLHSATHCSMIDILNCAKFHQKQLPYTHYNNMSTKIQYAVIFRALEISIVK